MSRHRYGSPLLVVSQEWPFDGGVGLCIQLLASPDRKLATMPSDYSILISCCHVEDRRRRNCYIRDDGFYDQNSLPYLRLFACLVEGPEAIRARVVDLMWQMGGGAKSASHALTSETTEGRNIVHFRDPGRIKDPDSRESLTAFSRELSPSVPGGSFTCCSKSPSTQRDLQARLRDK